MRLHSFLFHAVLIGGIACSAFADARKISHNQAQELVRDALVTLNLNGPSVRIERNRYDYAPEFYVFMAWWPNPHGSPVLGYYAVNPWTGDVWDVMGCKRISSPAIQAEQRSILKRSNLSPEAEGTVRALTPGCSPAQPNTKARLK